ncbi:hypothetical protein BDN70DRAFT_153736 [Pholiota conissans]|uniref:DUF6593 domain-containing protein n=1 Tax=Pholiota conissans TaxID=109636 RepID=A0A9P5YZ66_9AGAR|nr:hypothetical protein BDN70DRAFT_153736 [Pholiota conissans]
MSSNGPYTLIQWGDDPLRHHYIDHEGRMAFTVKEVDRNPNILIRVARETAWSQHYPSVLGPDNAYLYLGPESTMGYVIYGNNPTNFPMHYFLRPGKQPQSTSRYFRCQNGKDYKWKVTTHRMECFDGRTSIAVWDVSHPSEEYFAKLVITQKGMGIVTEILTSLIVNRMCLALGW